MSYISSAIKSAFLLLCTTSVLNLVLSPFDVCYDDRKLDSEVLQIGSQVLKGFGDLGT